MSKIKKINVIRKNCKEKIDRLFDLGENPHSKGLLFSVSVVIFKGTSSPTLNNNIVNTPAKILICANINI
jgi:hypothetical protein